MTSTHLRSYHQVMRVIHTSDWHLGRRLHGESLVSAHETFLHWLTTDLIKDSKPDLIVVSGDIYDRGIPPTEAIELFEETLAEIHRQNISVLITSGNHDSRVRLGSNTRFMSNLGLHFRTRLRDIPIPVELSNDEFTLLAYGIPYLEPDVDAGPNPEIQWQVDQSQTGVLAEAMRQINLDVAERRKKATKPIRVVVATHAFVQGATPSDSERNVKVGGLGQADAAVFAGIDYVAMGHIHRPHVNNEIKGTSGTLLRYSGSPIPFSFSERDDKKQVLALEFSKDGVSDNTITSIATPQIRGMKQIEGSIAEILGNKYAASDEWLKVVITDRELPLNAYETIKRKFPHLLEVVPKVSIDNILGRSGDGVFLHNLTPEEVTKRFVQRVTSEEPTKSIANAIDDCCDEVRNDLTQVTK